MEPSGTAMGVQRRPRPFHGSAGKGGSQKRVRLEPMPVVIGWSRSISVDRCGTEHRCGWTARRYRVGFRLAA